MYVTSPPLHLTDSFTMAKEITYLLNMIPLHCLFKCQELGKCNTPTHTPLEQYYNSTAIIFSEDNRGYPKLTSLPRTENNSVPFLFQTSPVFFPTPSFFSKVCSLVFQIIFLTEQKDDRAGPNSSFSY